MVSYQPDVQAQVGANLESYNQVYGWNLVTFLFSLKWFSDFDGKDLDWTPFASSPIFKIIFLEFIIDLIELIMIVIFFTRVVMHLKFAFLTDILKYSTSNSWHICSGFKGISLAKHTSCYR